ncbi:MAG: hypothetical protein U1E65_18890 [Myxococcota bacterium]
MAMSVNNGGQAGFRIGEPSPNGNGKPPVIHVINPENYKDFYNDIAQRRNAVEDQFRRGEISGEQKQALLDRLDHLADEVRVDKTDDGRVSQKDWAKYRGELNGIQGDLKTQATDADINVDQRAANMKGWVGTLNKQGKLTDKEAEDYKKAVDELAHRSPPPTEKDFAALEKQVRGAARDGDLNEGKLEKNFDQRIKDGKHDGSLSTADQARLDGEIGKLKGLSGEARQEQLHKIDSLIYELRHNSDIDPVARRGSLQRSIKESNLPEADKTKLLAQLSRYSASELNDFGAMLRTMHVPLKP